eukprot:jgi/Botrbrau1/19879/Bobra.0059s0002.2
MARSWMLGQQLPAEDTSKYGWLIEGSLVAYNHSGGRQAILQMFRTRTGITPLSTSMTDGVTWSRVKDTAVPNPNSKVSNIALPDGSILMALNDSPNARSPLTISRSRDGGFSWDRVALLEDEPSASFHYPAIFYHSDSGKVFVAYTVGYPSVLINDSSAARDAWENGSQLTMGRLRMAFASHRWTHMR